MQLGKASGLQVAFAILAAFLLAAPLSKFLGAQLSLSAEWFDQLARWIQLAFLALLIFAAERINPGVISRMLRPIPAERRAETAIAVTAQVLLPFAVFGAVVLWYWISGGAQEVEQRIATAGYHTIAEARAFSAVGLVHLLLGVAMAPLVEEIVFRGLLYRAWEERWGWIVAMLGSSLLFALLHTGGLVQFGAALLFVCLYRRTGTLVAPMLAHAVGNLCVWYWLVGRFYFPDPSMPAGDLASWPIHFAILTVFVVAGPIYLFMSRNAYPETRDEQPLPA
jgi:membrane protease YdiL (CAAX protease family)